MYDKLSLYKCAANLLQLAKESGANIKHILYNEEKYKFMNIKALYALVCEALKHWSIIELLINKSKILINEQGLDIWLVRILITEHIFGKKKIDSHNEFGHTILQYESKFRELLSKQDTFNTDHVNKNIEIKVRYIRVNPIKEAVDSVINIFIEEGWQQITTADNYQEYLDQLRKLEPHSDFFLQDFHIPEVLVFPPGTELYSHYLYKNGSFFFMDKSSCLAPYLLRPCQDSCVLDMCAAPGLKTIHLAGLVQSGKIYAVERDHGRFQSLKELVSLCGANNITPIHKDVTKLQTDQYADVEYILLDPSCSGSGMRGRQPLIKEDCDKNRLNKLAGFQLTLLRFALTRFPAVKRIVYSTCSLNEEENEEVVEAALNSKYHNFKVVSAGKKLSQWINFGSQKFSFGSKCIYSRPETDLTNGFFVAVFKRRKAPIFEGLPNTSVDTSDEYINNTKANNTHSEHIDCVETYSKQKAVTDQNELLYPIKGRHTNTTHHKIIENQIKKTQSKEIFYDSNVDKNIFCLPSKINKVNKIDSSKQNVTNNVLQKPLTTITGLNNSKKNLTASQKKRSRKRRIKSKLLQNSNIKKNKNKEETVKNTMECGLSKITSKTTKIKNKNTQNNSNETVPNISRANLRRQRLKKLKLKSNPGKNNNCKLETIPKDNEENLVEKKEKEMLISSLAEHINSDNTDILHKKRHKKKDASNNEIKTNQCDVTAFQTKSQKICITSEKTETIKNTSNNKQKAIPKNNCFQDVVSSKNTHNGQCLDEVDTHPESDKHGSKKRKKPDGKGDLKTDFLDETVSKKKDKKSNVSNSY